MPKPKVRRAAVGREHRRQYLILQGSSPVHTKGCKEDGISQHWRKGDRDCTIQFLHSRDDFQEVGDRQTAQ